MYLTMESCAELLLLLLVIICIIGVVFLVVATVREMRSYLRHGL